MWQMHFHGQRNSKLFVSKGSVFKTSVVNIFDSLYRQFLSSFFCFFGFSSLPVPYHFLNSGWRPLQYKLLNVCLQYQMSKRSTFILSSSDTVLSSNSFCLLPTKSLIFLWKRHFQVVSYNTCITVKYQIF